MIKNFTSISIWGFLVLALIFFTNLQLILVTFTPYPLTYTNVPYPLDKTEYHKKDVIAMTVGRCSSEKMPVAVTSIKEFYNPVSGVIIPLPTGSGIIPPGCSNTQTAFASVFPDNMDPGTYVIRGVTTVRGRYRTIDVSWQTQSFVYKGE